MERTGEGLMEPRIVTALDRTVALLLLLSVVHCTPENLWGLACGAFISHDTANSCTRTASQLCDSSSVCRRQLHSQQPHPVLSRNFTKHPAKLATCAQP